MERAHVFDAVAARWIDAGGGSVAPRPASREELLRVHSAGYLDAIALSSGRAVMLDPDTFTSPESVEIASLAAGAVVQAAEHAITDHDAAFALVRPPGHHAERDRAMGFCLYNNVAVAAAHAIASGLERVAIVDIDVHHGNGTQWMFYDNPKVLYVSTHQYPFYPGTGAANEIGTGEGAGCTFNVPLEMGATDADYALVYRAAVLPVIEEFAPELVLVSAGFDAHERDPLASMRVTTEGYASMVRQLVNAATNGAIAFVTEGGYDLAALSDCLDQAIAEASGKGAEIEMSTAETDRARLSTVRAERALEAVRAAQKPFWRAV
jgi:acetoin utilization deacetylase AcuC-like enzyme